MRSSYLNPVDYGDIFRSILFTKGETVRNIVEIGILDGYSLECMASSVPLSTTIRAFDIFDEFNGNCANCEFITNKFAGFTNVSISYGDFYKLNESFSDHSIDLLHVDIANNGDVIEYIFTHYMQKLAPDGIIVIEGGSDERDRIEWMQTYNKPKIHPVLESHKKLYDIITIGTMPSITLIREKSSS